MRAMMIGIVIALAGCAPRASEPTAQPPTRAASVRPAETSPAVPAPSAPASSATLPSPAQRPPQALLVQDGVNYACSTPADCAVKDVGNCCGYFPACVNKDSPTFPERVKAECSAQGMSSICGFQEVTGCDCIEGRCSAQPAAGGATSDLRQD